MKSFLTILAWLVVFTVVFSSGCEPTDSAKTDTAESDAPTITEAPVETKTEIKANVKAEAPAQTTVDSVAVTVNGVKINESQIEAQVKPQLERISAQLPPQFVEQYKERLRQQAIERMIVEQLLDEKVKEAKIAVADEQVNDKLTEIASQQQPPLSMEDFKALVEAYGQSFDEVKQRIRKGLGYQKIIETQFGDRINVTAEDANQYYKENQKLFESSEQVRASHILIKTDTADPNADPTEVKAKAKEKAQDLLKQIREGADFATLAKANSGCPSSAKGGDLGYGERSDPNSDKRGTWVAPFEKAAFKLKVGQVSDVVETQFGYHIIKLTDHKEAKVTTFEEAKDNILKVLTQNKQAELAKEYIESLKAEANIIYPPGKEPKPGAAMPLPMR
jgi:peptidyl-prolyl cis-trans isomerase C